MPSITPNALHPPTISLQIVSIQQEFSRSNSDVSLFDNGITHPNQNAQNARSLFLIFLIFFTFVIAEIFGASISHSLSLLSDASAMSIDVVTYFNNAIAEFIKWKYGKLSNNMRLLLECVLPSLSLCALVVTTVIILKDAISTIQRNGINSADEDVNVYYLYGFAIGNMLIDCGGSVILYLKYDNIFLNESPSKHVYSRIDSDELSNEDERKSIISNSTDVNISGTETPNTNINLLSSFTHIGGDTLRTLSVFIAALVSSFGITTNLCDAWATVVVSISIFFMIIPLVIEIIHCARKSNETI